MPKTAIDTNVLLAALLRWHEHHEVARHALELAFQEETEVLLPAAALVEAYAVLTRFPAPHRLSPQNAFELIYQSLGGRCRLVSLANDDLWSFLEGIARRQVRGRATYDSQILMSAAKAGADRILTLNLADFERLKPEGLTVVSPIHPT